MDGFVDLALTPEEVQEKYSSTPMAEMPKYPYGTSLSLDETILQKLNVDSSEWEVGNIFHLHAMAKVTAISEHENMDGKKCCVTLQVVALKGESEDEEDSEEEKEDESLLKKSGYLKYE